MNKYGESLILTTSEAMQWLSVTGSPKEGNPVAGSLSGLQLTLIRYPI